MKAEYENWKKALGDTYNPYNLVFCNSRGNIIALYKKTRALKRVFKAAGLPDIRFHDLPHSHATLYYHQIKCLTKVERKTRIALFGHQQ